MLKHKSLYVFVSNVLKEMCILLPLPWFGYNFPVLSFTNFDNRSHHQFFKQSLAILTNGTFHLFQAVFQEFLEIELTLKCIYTSQFDFLFQLFIVL